MTDNGKYEEFIDQKTKQNDRSGFDPIWMPDFLFDFQTMLTDWAIKLGRAAIFADCGLGKSPIQLVWADNVVRKTNGRVLILTPLTVSRQMLREAEKFGIEASDARSGRLANGINVVNYEQLHRFERSDFVGCVADESSILKNCDGKRRRQITDFMSGFRYRLLCSATPAPNDYIELGTSSEALGYMGRNQMLGMFFSHKGDSTQQWEMKGHACRGYWRWMASWSRAIRKPSDFGFDDGAFELPPLHVHKNIIPSNTNHAGFFNLASTLDDQRREKKATIRDRCDKVAELIPTDRPAVVWCHYNAEADLLEKMIPDAKQVAGRHTDEEKEDRLMAFSDGELRVLITKPKIAGFGMNWQHCSEVFCFPSHSYEQYYQTVRRCWRFGQDRAVNVNIIATEAERGVMKNMLRKERQAIEMFDGIIRQMHDFQVAEKTESKFGLKVEVPSWL